jgi:hypothetical protein
VLTLSDAIDDLFARKTQDSGRLNSLASYCIEAFARHGLRGVRGGQADEVGIRGLGRQKDWDLAYVLADKPRLLVSLKSILKNLSGVVPNRLDDLMGEAANVQQLSPELVIGYVVLMDEAEDTPRRGGGTWIDHFRNNLDNISIRKAPLWNQGLIEAAWLIRIDSRRKPGDRIVDTHSADADGVNFFTALVEELYVREPAIRPLPQGAVRRRSIDNPAVTPAVASRLRRVARPPRSR